MITWTPSHASALVALTDHALPGERLTEDELVTLCFEDPDDTVVLATPDGDAAVSLVVRSRRPGHPPVAHLQLLAVSPRAQGSGIGRRLLETAETWAAE